MGLGGVIHIEPVQCTHQECSTKYSVLIVLRTDHSLTSVPIVAHFRPRLSADHLHNRLGFHIGDDQWESGDEGVGVKSLPSTPYSSNVSGVSAGNAKC